MKHFYEEVEGWWSEKDHDFYKKIVDKYEDGSHFVEVGSFKGRSSVCMAVNIINSNKDIRFDCVDTWKGSEEHQKDGIAEDADVVGDTLHETFVKSIASVKDYINPYQTTSREASKLHEYESLDFVFIDGSHDFGNVLNDIRSWAPKIKMGGTLAGHDFGHEGVGLAVDFFFGENIKVHESCWYWEKTPDSIVPQDIEYVRGILPESKLQKYSTIGIVPRVLLHESYSNMQSVVFDANVAFLFKD